ncbi:MAG: hypothetical protein F6J86_24800 [Symploca sp. SIO1B1]|nr:hypothetical protein [Symploca sp. SIO2D2]NER20794.1 hypothetical protein [Symploca sp. SIO1C2]NER47139.1 hypothetical protein [Symploca sp. SIO1A3]NER97029.1 hypothetical protein [Symploca sp. SIO1B1]
MIIEEQIRQVEAIASSYENFKCVECAQAIKHYLISQKISGKRIKLDTGAAIDDRNNFIYDDSIISVDAISENGRHEGIAILINGVETIFDNHHPDGLLRDEWIENLQFFGKIHLGQDFQITEEDF